MQPGTGYTRIPTYLRGQFRTLRGPDDHAYAQLNTMPSGLSREEFIAASTLPEAVTHFLVQMDVKLDAILADMRSSSLDNDFPHPLEIVSIGASGVEFLSALPLAPGDWLELVIHIRQPGLATASGIGQVGGVKRDKDGQTVFSLAFTRILEEEREKIIRYVFKEERRQLRETRLDGE